MIVRLPMQGSLCPGPGRSYMPRSSWAREPWLLSLRAVAAEPARPEPVLRNKRGHNSERPAHRDEEWPRLPQLEKALAQKRRPNTAKIH